MELEEKQRKMKGILSEIEREELEDILRGLTPEKVYFISLQLYFL
jgi:hypothetical protein